MPVLQALIVTYIRALVCPAQPLAASAEMNLPSVYRASAVQLTACISGLLTALALVFVPPTPTRMETTVETVMRL